MCNNFAGSSSVAAVVVFIIIIVLAGCMHSPCTEKFVTEKSIQVQKNAKQLFDSTSGRATYSQYKSSVPGADPVQFSDTRKLWAAGNLTPEQVEASERS